ncbi:MAG: DUF2147 domain-containing protein [Pseudomonadota bacterium]
MLRRILLVCSTLSIPLLTTTAQGADAQAVVGFWSDGRSILHITRSEETLHATLYAFEDHVYLPEEANPGAPRLDDNNPEAGLRTRTLRDLNLLADYVFDGKRWSGKIYDPETGNTYSSRMSVDKDGRLNMRGYIGMPMFGRTAQYEPAEGCMPATRKLLYTNQREAIGTCTAAPLVQ